MKRHNYNKDELIKQAKLRAENLHVWGQLAISLGILIDVYDWTPEDAVEFMKYYDEWCDSYLNNKEDIIQMIRNIEDYTGLTLIKETKHASSDEMFI